MPFDAGPYFYTLYSGSLDEPEQVVTHEEFLVQTQPFQHSLCGKASCSATFEGQEVDENTPLPPVRYIPSTRTFEIYSEDFNLIGVRFAEIFGYLEEYPIIEAPFSEMVAIEFINPCINPVSVRASR